MTNQIPIYTIKDIKLTFGIKPLFTDVNLNICKGDKVCLVGRNGCGKSTLLKIISGQLEADSGDVFIQPGTKVSYMEQNADFSSLSTILKNELWIIETYPQAPVFTPFSPLFWGVFE